MTVAVTLAAVVAGWALAPVAGVNPPRELAWLLFIGSATHVGATGWVFTLGDVRQIATSHRGRYLRTPLLLTIGTASLAAILSARAFAWLMLPYFAWQFWHFQKQNLGLTALALKGTGAPSLTVAERRALLISGWCGVSGLLARPRLLQLTVAWSSPGCWHVAEALFVGVGVIGAVIVLRSRRPPPVLGIYLMSLWFPVPIFAFHSPYAAVAGLTIAHGLHYLLLLGLLSAARQPSGRRSPKLVLGLVEIALAGGLVLSQASGLHGGATWQRAIFGVYLGLVMSHFVIDAGLWRFRDHANRAVIASRLPWLLPAVPGHRGDVPLADVSVDEVWSVA